MSPRDVLQKIIVLQRGMQWLIDVREFGSMTGNVLTVVMEIDATFMSLWHPRALLLVSYL